MPAPKPSIPPEQRFERAKSDLRARRYPQARAALAALDAEVPGDFLIKAHLADCLFLMGQAQAAQPHIKAACAIDARQVNAWLLAARIALALNQQEEAEAAARRAAALMPDDADCLRTLLSTLLIQRKFAEAEPLARRALELKPGDLDLTMKQASALTSLGRLEASVAIYSALIERHPENIPLAESCASAMNYLYGADPTRVLEAHRRVGRLLSKQSVSAGVRPQTNAPSPDRPLKVGFISPDLRQHVVAFFLRAIFEKHDERAIQIFAYATLGLEDDTTELLRNALPTNRWRRITGMEMAAAVDKIRDDRLDILIDLSGLTQGHSLALFANRPAPLQVTYLGYPNTTGLGAMDARLIDSHTDPIGSEPFATERLLRLDPCFLCFTPPDNLPPVSGLPCLSSGSTPPPFTFGCFNALVKINDFTLRLWARVLAAVPNSRLLIKAKDLEIDDNRADFAQRVAAAGIPADRVEIRGNIEATSDHLSVYSRIDLALDPFPYHGTTTTCEALLMGVPVLSLSPAECRAHASRVGRSLLSVVDLSEFVADSEDRFVEMAREWASNPTRLGSLRAGLRQRVLTSALCDAPAFARRFENALRELWLDHLRNPRRP